jgi:hypothetical protein
MHGMCSFDCATLAAAVDACKVLADVVLQAGQRAVLGKVRPSLLTLFLKPQVMNVHAL